MTLKAFVPSYDSPTNDNARLALHVFPRKVNALIGNDATRTSLQALIQASDTTALLFMSHGNSDLICAQDGQTAIDVNDVENDMCDMLRLPIFAWVCKTSLGLGFVFHGNMKKTGSWWGYRTTISAPSPKELGAFKQALEFILIRFPVVNDRAGAMQFFKDLKTLCEPHRDRIVVAMARSRKYGEAQETASAFREMWEHLEGWLPDFPQPCHSGSKAVVEGV